MDTPQEGLDPSDGNSLNLLAKEGRPGGKIVFECDDLVLRLGLLVGQGVVDIVQASHELARAAVQFAKGSRDLGLSLDPPTGFE